MKHRVNWRLLRLQQWVRPESRHRYVDLVYLAAPSQVKSFQFQVAAEIFHSTRRRILG